MQIHQPIFTQSGTIGSVDLLGGTAVTKDPSTGLVTQCTSGICDGILTADAKAGMPCNFYIEGSFALALNGSIAITPYNQPLKVTTGGYLVPVTGNNDVIVAYAKQTAAIAGSLVEVRLSTSYYGA